MAKKKGDIPASMRSPHNIRRIKGDGEAWYYIEPTGLKIYEIGTENQFLITRKQIERALEIIKQEDKQR